MCISQGKVYTQAMFSSLALLIQLNYNGTFGFITFSSQGVQVYNVFGETCYWDTFTPQLQLNIFSSIGPGHAYNYIAA